jgi:pimeloyl-ACP methyl ester carboxylesterase
VRTKGGWRSFSRGAYDAAVPLANGHDYAKKIAGAKLVVFPECGHSPTVEKPQEFLKSALEFLGGK